MKSAMTRLRKELRVPRRGLADPLFRGDDGVRGGILPPLVDLLPRPRSPSFRSAQDL